MALADQALFLNTVYSYFVSHPSEFSSEARKNMADYMSGALDKAAEEEGDNRPITEQAADLMSAWDEFDKLPVHKPPTITTQKE